MSQSGVVQPTDTGLGEYHFFVRKLHSLLGLFPISFFLLEHLITNSMANSSPALFDSAVEHLQSIPYLPVIEVLLIALPLTIHALYGLYIVYVAKNNTTRYGYLKNWMFYLQRISALITLVFVVNHVYVLRISHSLYGLPITFQTMHQLLSNPLVVTWYAICLLAATFHMSNGIWSFSVSWGIVVGERAQEFVWKLCMLLFLILSVLGLTAIWAFIS